MRSFHPLQCTKQPFPPFHLNELTICAIERYRRAGKASKFSFQYYVYLLQSGVIKKPLEICKTDINLKKNLKELV